MMRGLGFLLGLGVAGAGFLLWLQPPVSPRPEPAGSPPVVVGSELNDQATVPPLAEGASPVTEAGPDQDPMAGDAGAATDSPAEDAPPQGGRYLFWAPFRSQLAARGFAARLSADTEVEVEVEALGPGRYRVGFDYQDEAERRALVNRIQVITGLELE